MLDFIKKPTGQVIIFLAICGILGGVFFYEKMTEAEALEGMDMVAIDEKEYDPIELNRSNSPFKRALREGENAMPARRRSMEEARSSKSQKTKDQERPQIAQNVDERRDRSVLSKKAREAIGGTVPQEAKKAPPLELFASNSSTKEGVSLDYAPYGRLIPCETVITIDSSQADTPIIGLVTEDVYHNGRLIIPAGVEVHGKASPDKFRERIDASGSWVLVWRDQSRFNGSEMTLTGVALDMSKDFVNGKWRVEDGSAGLKGNLIKSDQWAEVKLYAATFISALSQGVQKKQTVGNAFGETERVPKDSLRNAALQGNTAVIDRYADQIMKEIQEHGFYVRVPAGTQFYLYVTQALDLEKATIGNESIKDIWKEEENETNS